MIKLIGPIKTAELEKQFLELVNAGDFVTLAGFYGLILMKHRGRQDFEVEELVKRPSFRILKDRESDVVRRAFAFVQDAKPETYQEKDIHEKLKLIVEEIKANLDELDERKNKIKMPDSFNSREELAKFFLTPGLVNGQGQAQYSRLTDEMRKQFKYVYVTGGNLETEQMAFSLKFYRNSNIADIETEIRMFLPHMLDSFVEVDALRDENNPQDIKGKNIEIFDHELNERTNYNFLIIGDRYIVGKGRLRYDDDILIDTMTLTDALDYVRQHHYYELDEPKEK